MRFRVDAPLNSYTVGRKAERMYDTEGISRPTKADLADLVRFLAALFDDLDLVSPRPTLDSLLQKGIVKPMVEPAVPKVPMDYTWAKRLGLVRKPANFISSISDDRGDELRSVLLFSNLIPRRCCNVCPLFRIRKLWCNKCVFFSRRVRL